MMLPIAKVFTVTKNEYDLIEDFIIYHGGIFGYENIVVIDNGSTNPIVLDVYKKYSAFGVEVVHTTGYTGNMQAIHFTNAMNRFKHSAEFLIGLDTDCFFSVDMSCDKDTILSYLRSLPQQSDIFVVDKFLLSVVDVASPNYENNKLKRPTKCTTFVKRNGYAGCIVRHVFFRAANFVKTEIGNHWGQTKTNNSFNCENVMYVHYHDTGRGRTIERCREILLGYGYIHEGLTLEEEERKLLQCRDGSGIHRQRQYLRYLQSREKFLIEDPIPADTVYFSNIKDILEQ
jgi:hypothetical protein